MSDYGAMLSRQKAEQAAAEKYALESQLAAMHHQTLMQIIGNIK